MIKFNVWANACEFGIIEANNAQEARDKAARMAGYESESEMEKRMGEKSEIVAELIEFRFSDWNPKNQTCPAYFVDEQGLITVGRILIENGESTDSSGYPYESDNQNVRLLGWAHSECESYNKGKILVPIKGSRV